MLVDIPNLCTTIFMAYTGLVTLSPSREFKALVCSVGEQLELTCNTTGTFLRWNVTLSEDIAMTDTRPYTRLLAHSSVSTTASPLIIDSTIIHFTRTSSQGSLPLTSTLLIDHVTEGLNGTMVSCMEVSTSHEATSISATVIIHIINPGYGGKSICHGVINVQRSLIIWSFNY